MSDWQSRLDHIVRTMREMSTHVDPQAMVKAYGQRLREMEFSDGFVSVSRRDLKAPWYRITRSSSWNDEVNPWKERDRLPLFDSGLLGELLYGERPVIIDELHVAPDDPAAEHLQGIGSLAAIPHFDNGQALNMVLVLRKERHGFEPDDFPEMVWTSNLFGRATHNLVLSDRLQEAYRLVDHELKMVEDLQRSLLPSQLPKIPTLDIAAHYQTSRRAGGDYYDFFPLPDGNWGILLADVSGHGAGAAVLMAITHTIVHSYPGPPTPANTMLSFVNRKLAERYTADSGTFVTAFYGIYQPATRTLRYANAGHPPPRLRRCWERTVAELDGEPGLPLGIDVDEEYGESTVQLQPHDRLVFFTDGITEAQNDIGQMFGVKRMDEALVGCPEAHDLIRDVLREVDIFTAGRPADDDRTLVVARVE